MSGYTVSGCSLVGRKLQLHMFKTIYPILYNLDGLTTQKLRGKICIYDLGRPVPLNTIDLPVYISTIPKLLAADFAVHQV